MSDFIKTPCKDCPFRKDKKPFLHPNRAAEIAYAAQNPYNSFACHKTLERDESCDDSEYHSNPLYAGEKSKECAGFLTLREQMGGDIPEGFESSFDLCYESAFEMISAYEEEWGKLKYNKNGNT